MKRTFIIITTICLAAISLTSFAQQLQPHFSSPILVGGYPDSTRLNESRISSRQLHFSRHPKTPQGTTNFFDNSNTLTLTGYLPFVIHDLTAVSGSLPPNIPPSTSSDSPWLDSMPDRVQSAVRNTWVGGFDDFTAYLAISSPQLAKSMFLDYDYELAVEMDVINTGIVLSDIRNENPGEFATIFGTSNILADAGLIGNAQEIAPYDPNQDFLLPRTYSTTPDLAFQWCAPLPSLRAGNYEVNCRNALNVPLIDFPYDDIVMHGLADIGTGLVSASYDTFNIGTFLLSEGGNTDLVTRQTSTQGISFASSGVRYLHLVSPLLFFRMNDTLPSPRYVFSGYSTWQLPHVRFDNLTWQPGNNTPTELFKSLMTNPIIPPLTNPVDVVAIDLGGASSGRIANYPDTDLAVLYQGTLFDIARYVLDMAGRPMVFRDGNHYRMEELLGRCSTRNAAGNCLSMTTIAQGRNMFHDRVVSPVAFWKQEHQWGDPSCQGSNTGYECMNPSHVFDPSIYSLVGTGAFDAELLKDALQVTKEYLLVPSTSLDVKDNGIIYKIDPQGPHFYMKGWTMSGTQLTDIFVETPFILPEVVEVPNAPQNFVPYQVKAGNLDGDSCADIVVTWRGKDTRPRMAGNLSRGLTGVEFDDGTGVEFSNSVNIVYRSPQGANCVIDTASQNKIRKIDMLIGGQAIPISSVGIGDFYGDGTSNDLVLGAARQELVESGQDYSSFAYVLRGPDRVSQVPDTIGDGSGGYVRVRAGFWQGVSTTNDGIGNIAVDDVVNGPDAMGFITGAPPGEAEIGCPSLTTGNYTTPVASIFGTYLSTLKNMISSATYPNSTQPIRDNQGRFVSEWCAAEDKACRVPVTPTGGPPNFYSLPFWASDRCCTGNVCGTLNWERDCGKMCAIYSDKVASINNYCQLVRNLCSAPPIPAIGTPELMRLRTYTRDEIMRNISMASATWATSDVDTVVNLLFDAADSALLNANPVFPEFGMLPRFIAVNSTGAAPNQQYPVAELISMGTAAGQTVPGCSLIAQATPLPFPPQTAFDRIKFPRGAMSANNVITTVVRLRPKTCNPDGTIDTVAGEQCDTTGLPALASTQQCGAGRICDMRTCACAIDISQICANVPNAECRTVDACGTGRICDIDCKCHDLLAASQPPQIPPDTSACYCRSYSSDAMKDRVVAWNKKYWQDKGGIGDLGCEPEQTFECVIKSDKTAWLSIGVNAAPVYSTGTALPGTDWNVFPFMIVQSKGSVFLDPKKMEYKTVKYLAEPLILFPGEVPSAANQNVVLPNLTPFPNLAAMFSTARPLANIVGAEMPYQRLSNGGEIVNNALEHIAAVQIQPDQNINPQTTGTTIVGQTTDVIVGIINADVTSGTGLAGFNLPEGKSIDDFKIENRKSDPEKYITPAVASMLANGQKLDASAICDIPWEENMDYCFTIVRDLAPKLNEPAPAPFVKKFGFKAIYPDKRIMGGGACKGCYVNNVETHSNASLLRSILPIMLVTLISIGGIVIGRIRKR